MLVLKLQESNELTISPFVLHVDLTLSSAKFSYWYYQIECLVWIIFAKHSMKGKNCFIVNCMYIVHMYGQLYIQYILKYIYATGIHAFVKKCMNWCDYVCIFFTLCVCIYRMLYLVLKCTMYIHVCTACLQLRKICEKSLKCKYDCSHATQSYPQYSVQEQCRRSHGQNQSKIKQRFSTRTIWIFTNETDVKQTCGPWTWA